MTTAVRRWSVSGHYLYDGCPRAWWLRNIAGVPTEDTDESQLGVVLHAGLAAGYAEHDRCNRSRLCDYPAVIRHRVGDKVENALIDAIGDRDDVDLDAAYDTVMRALAHLGPLSTDRVLGVEVPMEISVDGVPITYRADALYERAGELVVRDWKSTSELPRARDLPGNRQLALGALCAARTYKPSRVRVEIASINAAVAVSSPIEVTAARKAGSVVAATARRAEADVAFTPTPGAVCSTCKVRAYCPVYAAPETVLVAPGPDGSPMGAIEV